MSKLSQSSFFKAITSKTPNNQKALDLYSELIFNKHYQALSTTCPILFSTLDEQTLQDLVAKFIQSSYCHSRFIWQIPKEFRRFIKDSKLLKSSPFVDELLWFEFSEIELFMKDYTGFKFYSFDKSSNFKLSKSAIIRSLRFKVYLKEFDKASKNYLLGYYDFSTHQVIYQEISDIIYHLLRSISTKPKSFTDILKLLVKTYHIDTALEDELYKSLSHLCDVGVLLKN